MLVLSRKTTESVVITTAGGERIVVTVVRVHHSGKVRLGIEADKSVTVHRSELQEKIDAERLS